MRSSNSRLAYSESTTMNSTLRWKGALVSFLGLMVGHTASMGDRDPDPEEKEGEDRRIGDDPGEVVWALTCAGQPPMTKTDLLWF